MKELFMKNYCKKNLYKNTIINFNLYIDMLQLFGQIWSQKLKFFKLTKIWYRGTMLS